MGIWSSNFGKGNKWGKGVIITETCVVGNYNYFGKNAIINNSCIGNYCSFAPNVQIGPGVHSKEYITTYQRISGKMINHSLNQEKVNIGNDVWCGSNVVIMQGIRVGDGAIIGANAVVTHDVPDFAIVVGVPARVINYRFSHEIIQEIKKSEWYEKDLNEAMKFVKELAKKYI